MQKNRTCTRRWTYYAVDQQKQDGAPSIELIEAFFHRERTKVHGLHSSQALLQCRLSLAAQVAELAACWAPGTGMRRHAGVGRQSDAANPLLGFTRSRHIGLRLPKREQPQPSQADERPPSL